jgi:S-adenosylmethionine:tRNA ribosyltransferase-isomerase
VIPAESLHGLIRTQDFSYDLPRDLIAYTPAERREEARLMVLSRADRTTSHSRFDRVVDHLRAGDLLVLNETRVIKARLAGEKRGTGGKVDILMLREMEPGAWEALVSPSRRIHPGTEIELAGGRTCRIKERLSDGKRLVAFDTLDVASLLEEVGEVPLPPYIKREPVAADRERYQTVYARRDGSVAAPTAGLHFTEPLLEAVAGAGVEVVKLTLHVGLGSFRPVKEDDPAKHVLEPEYFEIDQAAAAALNAARAQERRIVVVGTTSVRALETAADLAGDGPLAPAQGWTHKLILPPHKFRYVDALITNFHLPCSTLLMLVAAFAGRDFVLEAYREAVGEKYRFYSYGDAMIIL